MSGQLSNLFQCREQWISIELKPRGTDVTNMVVTGHADIGVLAVSEILVAGALIMLAPFRQRISWSRCLRPRSWRT